MANISFYLFESSNERQAQTACRLCRKFLKQHIKIWWLCAAPDLQHELDDLLWCFDPNSFIAHGIDDPYAPVCISDQLPEQNDCFIFNFNNDAIEQPSKYHHIIEIIENNEIAKQIGREKFKAYKKMGITPRTFKL